MKLKSLIIAVSLLVLPFAIQAQAPQSKPAKPAVENPWFISGGMGLSYATGSVGVGKLLSPAGQLAFGKQFSPVLSARLALSGWRGRYASETSGQAYGFFYGAATVDGMLNISQWIKRYPERPVDVNFLLGAGFNRAFEHNVSSLVVRTGLQLGIRLNSAFDANVEATINGVSDRWNRRDDHSFDTYTNLLLGLTYKFRSGYKCTTCLSVEYIDTDEVNECVNRMRAKTDTVYVEKVVEVEKEVAPQKLVRGISSYVFFGLGKTAVTKDQMPHVEAIANYMKKYPDSKASVAGYADKGTGNTEINKRLARQRSEAVVKILNEKYGIDSSRLEVSNWGDSEQPFEENDSNRVVIMIAE